MLSLERREHSGNGRVGGVAEHALPEVLERAAGPAPPLIDPFGAGPMLPVTVSLRGGRESC